MELLSCLGLLHSKASTLIDSEDLSQRVKWFQEQGVDQDASHLRAVDDVLSELGIEFGKLQERTAPLMDALEKKRKAAGVKPALRNAVQNAPSIDNVVANIPAEVATSPRAVAEREARGIMNQARIEETRRQRGTADLPSWTPPSDADIAAAEVRVTELTALIKEQGTKVDRGLVHEKENAIVTAYSRRSIAWLTKEIGKKLQRANDTMEGKKYARRNGGADVELAHMMMGEVRALAGLVKARTGTVVPTSWNATARALADKNPSATKAAPVAADGTVAEPASQLQAQVDETRKGTKLAVYDATGQMAVPDGYSSLRVGDGILVFPRQFTLKVKQMMSTPGQGLRAVLGYQADKSELQEGADTVVVTRNAAGVPVTEELVDGTTADAAIASSQAAAGTEGSTEVRSADDVLTERIGAQPKVTVNGPVVLIELDGAPVVTNGYKLLAAQMDYANGDVSFLLESGTVAGRQALLTVKSSTSGQKVLIRLEPYPNTGKPPKLLTIDAATQYVKNEVIRPVVAAFEASGATKDGESVERTLRQVLGAAPIADAQSTASTPEPGQRGAAVEPETEVATDERQGQEEGRGRQEEVLAEVGDRAAWDTHGAALLRLYHAYKDEPVSAMAQHLAQSTKNALAAIFPKLKTLVQQLLYLKAIYDAQRAGEQRSEADTYEIAITPHEAGEPIQIEVHSKRGKGDEAPFTIDGANVLVNNLNELFPPTPITDEGGNVTGETPAFSVVATGAKPTQDFTFTFVTPDLAQTRALLGLSNSTGGAMADSDARNVEQALRALIGAIVSGRNRPAKRLTLLPRREGTKENPAYQLRINAQGLTDFGRELLGGHKVAGEIDVDYLRKAFMAGLAFLADKFVIPQRPSAEAQAAVNPRPAKYRSTGWARRAPDGYEVSTRGDKRFSALNAVLKDGRTIEEAYQLDVKGYRDASKPNQSWRDGKGKPPKNGKTKEETWQEYKTLWARFLAENPELAQDLRTKTAGKVLTDMFASTDVSQARALHELIAAPQSAAPRVRQKPGPSTIPQTEIDLDEDSPIYSQRGAGTLDWGDIKQRSRGSEQLDILAEADKREPGLRTRLASEKSTMHELIAVQHEEAAADKPNRKLIRDLQAARKTPEYQAGTKKSIKKKQVKKETV